MFNIISNRTLLSSRHSLKNLRTSGGNLCFGVSTKTSTPTITITSPRCFSALSNQEEEEEKMRVEGLSKYEKEMELRNFDKELARFNTLRGINTGELYTFRGKFKALARDYGMGFMAWYWTVWMSTACLTYGAVEMGVIDASAIIAKADAFTGFDMTSKVDPQLGAIGITLVLNEMLEPIRLPIVVMTTKPVIERFYPKHY